MIKYVTADGELSSSIYSYILDFLSNRQHVVRLGSITSSSVIRNTCGPQGCVLSPLLYSLYTYYCRATNTSNIIVKFDTTVSPRAMRQHKERRSVPDTLVPGELSPSMLPRPKSWFGLIRRCGVTYSPIIIIGAAVERACPSMTSTASSAWGKRGEISKTLVTPVTICLRYSPWVGDTIVSVPAGWETAFSIKPSDWWTLNTKGRDILAVSYMCWYTCIRCVSFLQCVLLTTRVP